jgi:hypothetical protein
MGERPRDFWLNGGHPLATGLVFAGLGRVTGSTHYRDSSPYNNHGTLTNMDAATDWVWSDYLQRWVLDFDPAATADYVVATRSPTSSGTFTISGWARHTASGNLLAHWSTTPIVVGFGVTEHGRIKRDITILHFSNTLPVSEPLASSI